MDNIMQFVQDNWKAFAGVVALGSGVAVPVVRKAIGKIVVATVKVLITEKFVMKIFFKYATKYVNDTASTFDNDLLDEVKKAVGFKD